jgi:hypothetical protein
VGTEQDQKSQNKMNKSFVLSGGRKSTPSNPVYKPINLPDFQNGNVNQFHERSVFKRYTHGKYEALIVLNKKILAETQ